MATMFLWFGDRPRAMRSNGRKFVDVASDEFLFFRWFNDHLECDGLPQPDQMKVPDQSANRSGLGGRCWYVLISDPGISAKNAAKHLCMGVFQILVRDIEYKVAIKETEFWFVAEHDPVDCNYFHCELRAFRNGVRLSGDKAKQLARGDKTDFTEGKKWFRTEIAKRLRQACTNPFPIPTIVSTAGTNKTHAITTNQSLE